MNISEYQATHYDSPPCWKLVADVYRKELNIELLNHIGKESHINEYAEAFRIELTKGTHGFKRIDIPVDYCVVLMAEMKNKKISHCGIYYKGKILHASSKVGVIYQDMFSAKDQFTAMEFWAW